MPDDLAALIQRVKRLDRAGKQQVFEAIKDDIAVHKLEERFGVSVQVICEAILRATDLTQRGIRGVIAETVFAMDIVPTIIGWSDDTPAGNLPYDVRLTDGRRHVGIQVKLQRREQGEPLMRARVRNGPKDFYAVEVQRTRTGTSNGEGTRPYRFNEFDLLAVCMQPSTGDWHHFLYIAAKSLQPKIRCGVPVLVSGERTIETIQCVPPYPTRNDPDWTADIANALQNP
ncbi:MAG: hypothetical protein ACRD1F_08355 [Terriglobales bacterium]